MHASEAVLDFFDRDAASRGIAVDRSAYLPVVLWSGGDGESRAQAERTVRPRAKGKAKASSKQTASSKSKAVSRDAASEGLRALGNLLNLGGIGGEGGADAGG
jgi:hypothetical protein